MKTFDEFLNQYLNQKVEAYDSTNAFQCMDLATLWCVEGYELPNYVFAGFLWPKDIWQKPSLDLLLKFDFVQNLPDNKPEKGDIVISPTHIVVATGEGDLKTFKALSQNDPIDSPSIIREYNYDKVLGWLHYNSKLLVGTKIYEKLVTKSTWFDEICRLIGLAVNDSIDEVKRVLAEKEVTIQGYQNQITQLKSEIEKLKEKLEAGQSSNPPQPPSNQGQTVDPPQNNTYPPLQDEIRINLKDLWAAFIQFVHTVFIVQKGETKHE